MEKMSKKLVLLFVNMIIFSTITGAISSTKMSLHLSNEATENEDYSHTVFAGAAFTQACGPCHAWNQNIYNTYASGEFDFEYASMVVYDENGNVLIRKAYDWDSNYSITTYPTTIIDGDYKKLIGNVPAELPNALNESGNRTVANITANLNLTWVGNASINITLNIENNESNQYDGYIRVFLTEIISRYKTSLGEPFHFGFLDFPIYGNISINPGSDYNDSTIWNGNEHEDEHGDDFGDINPHNIKLILVIYNQTTGYVDELVQANISNHPPYEPTNPYPSNGSTAVDVNVDLSWTGGDPEDDPVTYDIYFGTASPPPKIVANHTNTTYDIGTLNISKTYYWKIIAYDNYNESTSGPIWFFTTRKNSPPLKPEKPFGPSNGTIGSNYYFSTITTDPDKDQVYYMWDWGDGNLSGWLGPYLQGTSISACHSWNESKDYKIKVKAKDIFNEESNWSDHLTITILKPTIEIGNITGGVFRLKTVLANADNWEVKNITWNISLKGGLILRGRQTSDIISSISPKGQVNIRSKRIIGFGRIKVTISTQKLHIPLQSKTEKGVVFLFFIKMFN